MKHQRMQPAFGGKRLYPAAERAATAARIKAAAATKAAAVAGKLDTTELEEDEHAFLVSKLRQRLALLHAPREGHENDATAPTSEDSREGPAPENEIDTAAVAAHAGMGALAHVRDFNEDPFSASRELVGPTEGNMNQYCLCDLEQSEMMLGEIAVDTFAYFSAGLQRKLADIAYEPPPGMRRTPWIETLAVVAPAVLAADALGEEGSGNHEEKGEVAEKKEKKETKFIGVNADIEREAYFMRLATAAATEGLRRLRQLRVKFTRPSDFYAEMLKSDQHMERVRRRLEEERQQQQQFLEKKNRERNKKFHKKSGHKLLRAQEEARLRNIELRQLEEWKDQRKRGLPDNLESEDGHSGSGGNGVAMAKRKHHQYTAGAGGRGSAVEAALDQWLADREKEKEKKQKSTQLGERNSSSKNIQRQKMKNRKQRRRK